MSQSASNVRLRSARHAAGYRSQQELATALGVGVRQVRRWESENPPWPHPELQQALTDLLGQDLESLGFTPPAGRDRPHTLRRTAGTAVAAAGLVAIPVQSTAAIQPASVAADFEAVTRSHRRLYWSVAPATLHPAAVAHAALGCALLTETTGQTRRSVAAALAESYLLAGRIEFFDLRDSEHAGRTLLLALQAAGQADDPLLGAAILAHSAFIPAWDSEREAAAERMVAARTYARRGPASAEFLAWLDAVEAECETRCGNIRTALHLIGHAEDVLRHGTGHTSPPGWTGSPARDWRHSRATPSWWPVICPRPGRLS